MNTTKTIAALFDFDGVIMIQKRSTQSSGTSRDGNI